uniref:SMC hinge domain-containing protein n=1 Tax=Heterorhabditis bacteriophora TaxID=37862 RepID=A0A1I7XSN2_HETBA
MVSAIQFVLSDEFSHLRSEQRMGVLHEGTGPRINTARVEIVFDNNDRRIPAVSGSENALIEATEVRVVRQVGQKKDQYYIDGKMVPRAEVIFLIDSYINSPNLFLYLGIALVELIVVLFLVLLFRLKLLREVAGTRVYDERKEESLKILKETHNKTKKIEALLTYIDERLKTLEEEKEDLKEYQKWDKMKRSIEYTIYDTDINETRRKLDRLADQREELNSRQTKVNSELMDVQARGVRVGTEQRKLEARFKGMKEEKWDAINIREKSGRNKAEDVLNQLKTEIREKEDELEKITPIYQKLVEQESALSSDVRIAETRSKELFAKQGHRDQFKSAEERDAFLRREVRHMARQIGETEDQMKDIEKSLDDESREEEQMNSQIREFGVDLQENHINMDKASAEHGRLKQECDKAVVAQLRQIMEWKACVVLFSGSGKIILMADIMMSLMATMVRGYSVILPSVTYYIYYYYSGVLMELIECDPVYFQAVEVTAGNRLFYHVVSDDRVAMKLLKQVNQQGLPGECNFFPVNRVIAPNKKETQDEV